LKRGELPSTADLAQAIDKSKRSLDERLARTSDQSTSNIVKDTQAALGATKEFLESKNFSSRLQSIYSEASQAGDDFPEAVGLNAQDREILREMRLRALEASVVGRELLRMMISKPDIRKSLMEMLQFLYDVFYKVGESVVTEQPSADSNVSMAARTKQAAQTAEHVARGKRTESERQALAERLHRILKQLRDNPLHQQAVDKLLRLADLAKISAERAETKLEKATVELKTESHSAKVLQETKSLAEEFLGGEKSLDPLLDKLKALMLAIRADQPVADHFRRWRSYVETSMKEPNMLSTDEFLKKGSEMTEAALNLTISDELRNISKEVYKEWKDVLESFKQDQETHRLVVAYKKLMNDITKRDELGRTTLDVQALARFRPIVVDILRKNLEKIPLPDITGENEIYQWKAWNLVVEGAEIVPDYIQVNTSTQSQAAITEERSSWLQGDLVITIQNIRTKLENVNFWINRKTFPKGEETGVVDIDGGFTVVIKLALEASADSSAGVSFSSGLAYCKADNLQVNIRETKHDILYNLFSRFWLSSIKKNIEELTAEKLTLAIKDFKQAANDQMAEIQKSSLTAAIPEAVKQLKE